MSARGFGDRGRMRGGMAVRGGAAMKKRMPMEGMGVGGPMRPFPRPSYMSSANSVPVPYGMPVRPAFSGGLPANPSGKYGFFDGPSAFGPPGYEKRSDAALKPPGIREGPPKPQGIPPLIRPPTMGDSANRPDVRPVPKPGPGGSSLPVPPPVARGSPADKNGSAIAAADRNGAALSSLQALGKDEATGTEGMNELFAKMVWKKLDMIKDPVRLSRLHIEIMNILQMAIAEETAQQS